MVALVASWEERGCHKHSKNGAFLLLEEGVVAVTYYQCYATGRMATGGRGGDTKFESSHDATRT